MTMVKVRLQVGEESFVYSITVVQDKAHPKPILKDELELMVYGRRQDENGPKWHHFSARHVVTYTVEDEEDRTPTTETKTTV